MRFLRSLRFAMKGIAHFFQTEDNGKLQLVLAVITITAGWFFHISNLEWLMVTMCIGVVISIEMVNTAIEEICGLVTREFHPRIKIIKDLSAGAVAVAALASLVTGGIVFIPKIISLF